jgi:hypothetical protein
MCVSVCLCVCFDREARPGSRLERSEGGPQKAFGWFVGTETYSFTFGLL